MTKIFATPQARLVGRALLAGAAVFVTKLKAGDGAFSIELLESAGVAGAWAVTEYITPLNALIGYFKTAK